MYKNNATNWKNVKKVFLHLWTVFVNRSKRHSYINYTMHCAVKNWSRHGSSADATDGMFPVAPLLTASVVSDLPTLCPKNVPPEACHEFDRHEPMFIWQKCYWESKQSSGGLFFHLGKQETWKLRLFTQCRITALPDFNHSCLIFRPHRRDV